MRWILGRKYELRDEQPTLVAVELSDSDAIVTMTDDTGVTYSGAARSARRMHSLADHPNVPPRELVMAAGTISWYTRRI